MKRNYIKPSIRYEDFGVFSSSGSACEGIANFGDENSCAVYVPGLSDLDLGFGPIGNVFTDALDACEATAPGYQDSVCYHAPSDNNNVFSS